MKNWFLRKGLVYRNDQLISEDVLIIDGIIVAFGEQAQALRDKFQGFVTDYDAEGLIISRGFIDLHVHLREPGGESKETIATGTKAAAAGGFTSVYAMPNTTPTLDNPEIIAAFTRRCNETAMVNVHPIAALTRGRLGQELVDYATLRKNGIRLFSDDGDPLSKAKVLQSMKAIANVNAVLVNHLEDKSLVGSGLFYQDIPAESEYQMLERDLQIVAETGCSYHAAHLSCAESVELIAQAKAQGLPVSAEVTPHHLVLTHEDIQEPLGHYQMKPPLRSRYDRDALVSGLRDGIIDVIATDHAPHGFEKENGVKAGSPFGVTGLETAFSVVYTHLVQTNKLSFLRMLECLTHGPAIISGEFPQLSVGSEADIVVLDLTVERQVSQDGFFSKGTNSPFVGQTFAGWPVLTLVCGTEKYRSHT